MIAKRPPGGGFVLVATLALLALATLAVTGGARKSLVLASDVARREEAYRTRLLSHTSRRVLAAKAPELLLKADQSLATTTFRIQGRLSKVEVTVADESAKPRLVAEDQRGSRRLTGVARWRSLVPKAEGSSTDTDFALTVRNAGREATVWGDGRLNLKTAPVRVLRATLGERLGADRVERVIAVREEHPDWTTQQVVEEAEDNARRRGELLGSLRDSPAAYTVWTVVAPRAEGSRPSVALDVLAGSQSGAQPESYTW